MARIEYIRVQQHTPTSTQCIHTPHNRTPCARVQKSLQPLQITARNRQRAWQCQIERHSPHWKRRLLQNRDGIAHQAQVVQHRHHRRREHGPVNVAHHVPVNIQHSQRIQPDKHVWHQHRDCVVDHVPTCTQQTAIK